MPERRGSAVLALVLAALAAPAATADGFYVEIEPGLATLADPDLTVNSEFFDQGEAKGDIEADPTWVIGGSVGYRYHGLRAEIDASYRDLDFDQVSLRNLNLPGGGGEVGDDGDLSAFIGLLNAFYGVRFGRFEPFVGAGLGFADLDIDANYGANVLVTKDDSTEFAWSISGGVSFAVHDRVDLSIGYRYIGMTDPDFIAQQYVRVNPDDTFVMLNGEAEIDVVLHEFFAGIRYNF